LAEAEARTKPEQRGTERADGKDQRIGGEQIIPPEGGVPATRIEKTREEREGVFKHTSVGVESTAVPFGGGKKAFGVHGRNSRDGGLEKKTLRRRELQLGERAGSRTFADRDGAMKDVKGAKIGPNQPTDFDQRRPG